MSSTVITTQLRNEYDKVDNWGTVEAWIVVVGEKAVGTIKQLTENEITPMDVANFTDEEFQEFFSTLPNV